MIKQKDNNAICNIMYNIRDALNDDDTLRALSLANDLYFDLLRITIDNGKITCNITCGESE